MIQLTVLVACVSACTLVSQPGPARVDVDVRHGQRLQFDAPVAGSLALAASFDSRIAFDEPFMLEGADWQRDAAADWLAGPRLEYPRSPDFSVLVALCRKAVPQCAPPVSTDADEKSASDTLVTGLTGAPPFSLQEPAPHAAHGSIDDNLLASLIDADVPSDVVAQVGQALSGRVAMHAAARKGDHFSVRYERVATCCTSGTAWRLVAAELRLRGERHTAVWFAAPGRPNGDYYTFDGEPLATHRFAMPVRYARISSPFGMRAHPVTGTRHGHSGTDFAAPIGTPVHAAAAGTVQRVAHEGGYGRYVVVRHGNGYSTLYAHLSEVDRVVRTGASVKQGQRLGAVGRTGVATGPHLHFEVHRRSVPIDPVVALRERLTPDLAQAARPAFARTVNVARIQMTAAARDSRIAVAHRSSQDVEAVR
ncbi:M23 family metallopeptidase [Burkholderia ubonensis]|uniref:M23 family metallopeptidase n=1 Tax=Burkholderia ubonensis TaxID=101571 RepID=UPI000A92F86C|nr:M23 family metallopeptidase [Burkholderia ubonensis]